MLCGLVSLVDYLASTRRFLVCSFFNDSATTEIYTLSLHDALPICRTAGPTGPPGDDVEGGGDRTRLRPGPGGACGEDRKSTRLNSSHLGISYAVFCLKKKKKKKKKQKKQQRQKTIRL